MSGRLLILVVLMTGMSTSLAGITPELQKQIRAATFEVVMKKPADDFVKYEKTLPLELVPFLERTDQYRSVGTAFALDKNVYVTAGHVLVPAIGSQFGAPAVRTSDGHIHPIAKILKFSAAEDFAVFSVTDELDPGPLPASRTAHVDEPVLAVGNALGDGIVIRDGILTSETPEEQDGRWKWIRFSAAASPGNSGGPLLDEAGHVIGVVVAKSPNENLNYALPIGNVLDAPTSHAVFDRRLLTTLPFAQLTKTYVLKDQFALPVNWETFCQQYQSLAARHSAQSRDALLSTYTNSLFPHGNGAETILYGPEMPGREMSLVSQRSDGGWALESPAFQWTDLPGDGKVAVGVAGPTFVLALHRGNEASDDAFYGDSQAFMDVALKVLNVRRMVGSDPVKVTSLGRATTDTLVSDHYGRRWQLRVWPIPFLDVYIVAQLLPTPDGYFALIRYTPSGLLADTKEEMALLASQATLTYTGTLEQWRAFLKRTTLLPNALKEVQLESAPSYKLRTRKFETWVPPDIMKVDPHSELLLTMNYVYDGPAAVWDIASAWWYMDKKEKYYIGLWRKPRPPATAKLEARTLFEDLQNRRSPYDGSFVQATSDAGDVSMAIQAPGTRAGMASSDVMYGLSMRVPFELSSEQLTHYQKSALAAVHILEHGVGTDVPQSPPITPLTQAARDITALRVDIQDCDSMGKDVRGRLCSQDYEEYIVPLFKPFLHPSPENAATAEELWKSLKARASAFHDYWIVAPTVTHNRDLWQAFLAHNHLPKDTQHNAPVLAAESSLNDLIKVGGPPTADWVTRAKELRKIYVDERRWMANRLRQMIPGMNLYRKRRSNCPEPANKTSGTAEPRLGAVAADLAEYYPPELARVGAEGLVSLSVKVNKTGCATDVSVVVSSGSDEFDEAALKWIETATFLPAERDGVAVDAAKYVGVDFKLNQ